MFGAVTCTKKYPSEALFSVFHLPAGGAASSRPVPLLTVEKYRSKHDWASRDQEEVRGAADSKLTFYSVLKHRLIGYFTCS